jgi:hypothetical protein
MDLELLAKFQQIYKDLDLLPLVKAEDIEKFRVDFGLECKVRLRREIEASQENGKFLFTGHRGCGKSTLLKRLAIEMSDKHHVVFFSIADMIEMTAVTHTNILYVIALLMLSDARTLEINIDKEVQETVLGWNDTIQKQIIEKSTKASTGVKVDFLSVVTALFQREKNFRDLLETTFAKKISDLVGKIDRLANAIKQETNKPVLVIIDDLDKLDLPFVEAIYLNNIKALFSPEIRIVFTIPVSSTQEPQVIGAFNSEGGVMPYLFPVAKFFEKIDRHDPDAKVITKNLNTFLKVLEKRIPEGLIEPQTAREMVLKSGGVMRELVRIARECCIECMVLIEIEPERKNIVIDQQILKTALRNLRHGFARQIGASLYELLVKIYETSEAKDSSNEDFVKLLHGLMVLEYENDFMWYDVHPIVVDLLKERKLIEA